MVATAIVIIFLFIFFILGKNLQPFCDPISFTALFIWLLTLLEKQEINATVLLYHYLP